MTYTATTVCSVCDRPQRGCGCGWGMDRPICPDCGCPILGSHSSGRCIDCYEETQMIPSSCGPGCDIVCPHS